jgi:hypothetical protein
MRIREENCNMILLAAVTLVSVAIAGGVALFEPAATKATTKPVRFMDRPLADTGSADGNRIIAVSDGSPVRVVGAPFVPNTNPHQR